MNLCILSALCPGSAGPPDLHSWDLEDGVGETAKEIAGEVVEILGESQSLSEIAKLVEESLIASTRTDFLHEYTGRKAHGDMVDNFYDKGVVIGPPQDGAEVEVRRVEDFQPDDQVWRTLVLDREDGREERIRAITRYGSRGNGATFCWERPYRYFKDWMRHSSLTVALWDDKMFASQFCRLLESDTRA